MATYFVEHRADQTAFIVYKSHLLFWKDFVRQFPYPYNYTEENMLKAKQTALDLVKLLKKVDASSH